MAEQRTFEQRQIVWGKVGEYPWWPGKIVGNLIQNNRNVYKVNFFGDSSYCYLHPEYIQSFETFKFNGSEFFSQNSKLKKPYELALIAFNKSKTQLKNLELYQLGSCKSQLHPPLLNEETKLQSKEHIEILQKTPFNDYSKENQNQQCLSQIINVEVSTENILDLLSTDLPSKLREFKGYNDRKKAFDFLNILEFTLLEKYNLNNLNSIPQIKTKPRISLKKHKKQKKVAFDHNNSIKRICIKKVYTHLKQKSYHQCRQHSIKIVQKIEQLGGGNFEIFKKMFVILMRWLNDKDLSSNELLNFDNILFSDIIQKRQDQQNSKMTQIPFYGIH